MVQRSRRTAPDRGILAALPAIAATTVGLDRRLSTDDCRGRFPKEVDFRVGLPANGFRSAKPTGGGKQQLFGSKIDGQFKMVAHLADRIRDNGVHDGHPP